MKFPVAEKISPIFVGAETKKGRPPQLLTESAGTHPPHEGHGQNVKNCGDRGSGRNEWVSLWERGLFLFFFFFFFFFCLLSCIGHHSAGSRTPRRFISTSCLDLCGLWTSRPANYSHWQIQADIPTGGRDTRDPMLWNLLFVISSCLGASEAVTVISIHGPLHITGKPHKSGENMDCQKAGGLCGELLQVIMAWPQFVANETAALSISTSISTTTTTTGVPFAPHSLYK